MEGRGSDTATSAQQMSLTRQTWAWARGLPASWEADTVFVADAADEEDVTEHGGKRGQGGDVTEEQTPVQLDRP